MSPSVVEAAARRGHHRWTSKSVGTRTSASRRGRPGRPRTHPDHGRRAGPRPAGLVRQQAGPVASGRPLPW